MEHIVIEHRGQFLQADEPAAYEWINEQANLPVLLTCDHAGRHIPRHLQNLGLAAQALEQHIAYDIGAAGVTRALSKRLGVQAILSTYSRLVIDPNRYLSDPMSIPVISDNIIIPGNKGLSAAQAKIRADHLFWPYHRALAQAIAGLKEQAHAPALIFVHSFTPGYGAKKRPWEIGILWNRDPRLATPLMAALQAHGDITVGDNQPYSGRAGMGYSDQVHAEAFGYPHVTIEIRQDLIESPQGIEHWADILFQTLLPILNNLDLYRIYRY